MRRAGRRLAPAAFPQLQPPPTPLPACPSSFTAADLKKLSDGNYAFALWATVNGLQSVMAMSTFFTLASGAPELPDDEALAAAAEEARRAREEEEAAAAAADDSDGGYGGGGLLGAAQAVLDAATAHDSDRGGSDTAVADL